MKIYSMTATFGKLEHETLTLEPGLNLLYAPNEWGKSTWCAFLVAMLYGIETRVHSTKAALADKERYAPWSGSPMSGRIDLCWNGRDITVERSSKGRSVFGVFKAYETKTGLEIPELKADNCGQVLLGVEKSVFLRSGFLKLTDLPVTQDESLRRRLNALVTTGDESGTADALAQSLRELKNRCRANRTVGLLPQAEQQRSALEEKLEQLERLETQAQGLLQRQDQLQTHHEALKNHQAALAWEENRAFAQKLAQAQAQEAAAEAQAAALEIACQGLPEMDQAQHRLQQLEQLQGKLDTLHMDAQLLLQAPQAPALPEVFRELETVDIVQHAETDQRVYREVTREKQQWLPTALGIGLAVLSLLCLLIPHWAGIAVGILGILAGLALARMNKVRRRRAANTAHALEDRYRPIRPEAWAQEARHAREAWQEYQVQLRQYAQERQELARRAQVLKQETEALAGDKPLAQVRREYQQAQEQRLALAQAGREHQRCRALVQALQEGHRAVEPPKGEDLLTYPAAETRSLLAQCESDLRQLHEQLGRCKAQRELLGSKGELEKELAAVTDRIRRLEDTYAALELAQQTLTAARAELQRRFAPRIASRAQEIFSRLTQGRYDRLTLTQELSLEAGAKQEDTLRSALWRSDGTVDQMYLALRLAVAEELTPQAPLILDDALVRFDDGRLREALGVLREAAQDRQVLVFSCQKREMNL